METQFINLNMTPTGINPCFHVSQYDIGRSLGFMIYNGSEVVDLDSYTCTIEATRSDGVAITSSVATDDNVGTFETTATMTNKADKYKAQFVIVNGDSNRIASLPFDMEITKAAMDENAESIEEDASLYQQYTEAVQGAIAEANADIQAEENARIAAVSAEATARANAITAEATARQTADDALQGNINAEASARASADSNLQSQIDQIIAPSGEAPSAAEVENARIGVDGVTYDTLGNAIRGQVSDLRSALMEDAAWQNGKYYHSTNGISDSSAYKLSNNIYVIPGSKIVVRTQMAGSACIAIFNSENVLIQTVGTQSLNVYDYEFDVPLGASYMLVSCIATAVGVFFWYNKNNDTLKNIVKDDSFIYEILNEIEVKNGYVVYDNGQFNELSTYKTYYYSVNAGDILSITSTVGTGGVIALAVFYNGNTYNGYYAVNKTSDFVEYTNELVKVPANTTKMAVTFRTIHNAPVVKKRISEYIANPHETSKSMVAVYNNQTNNLKFKFKRTANEDLIIEMGKPTTYGNGLFDFLSFKKVSNSGALTMDFSGDTVLTNVTDFFAPYKVQAINNINGDLPTNYADHFTGGCHRYNNNTTGTTATARCASVFVLFDGEPTTSGDTIFCDEIYVKWVNYIQGNNTKKEDGSGREILKETWEAIISRNEIKVHNTIEALEDINILRYYGIETYIDNTSKFRFMGGENRGVLASPANSGNKTTNAAESSNTGLAIRMELDMLTDLGQMKYTTNDFSFFASGKKCYSWTINTTQRLNSGCIMEIKGCYSFVEPF